MDKKHYLNLLKDLTVPLFNITYENEKPILTDKRLDVAVEIGNLLFRLSENQEITYQVEEIEMTNILIVGKKQKKIADLFNFMIHCLVHRLNKIIIDVNDELDILIKERFDNIISYIREAKTAEDIIWQQSLFDDVRKQLKDDVARARYKPSGAKGFGKCGRCNSEELYVNEKQTRSCDEPMTVNYLCLDCGHKWRRG